MIFSKFIEKFYRARVHARADEKDFVFYFSHSDFEGMKRESHGFRSSMGHDLSGNFYYYGDRRTDRLIVFDHGMGAGHRSYMREIEMLARRGYTVFSYDHTGCAESGGESTNGFAQSLRDLNDALNEIKSLDEYKNAKISVIGHSWGGFSTLNIGALHPDITHLVAISGFASVERIVYGTFHGLIRGFRRRALEIENEVNPDFVGFKAEESLKKTDAKLLVIHSSDDSVVSFKWNFAHLKKALSERANTEFFEVFGKDHNPNYEEDAVKYKNKFLADMQRALKRGELSTPEDHKAFKSRYDWKRMTAQDVAVWNKIFDFLED